MFLNKKTIMYLITAGVFVGLNVLLTPTSFASEFDYLLPSTLPMQRDVCFEKRSLDFKYRYTGNYYNLNSKYSILSNFTDSLDNAQDTESNESILPTFKNVLWKFDNCTQKNDTKNDNSLHLYTNTKGMGAALVVSNIIKPGDVITLTASKVGFNSNLSIEVDGRDIYSISNKSSIEDEIIIPSDAENINIIITGLKNDCLIEVNNLQLFKNN